LKTTFLNMLRNAGVKIQVYVYFLMVSYDPLHIFHGSLFLLEIQKNNEMNLRNGN
jgi:hypothetical protein